MGKYDGKGPHCGNCGTKIGWAGGTEGYCSTCYGYREANNAEVVCRDCGHHNYGRTECYRCDVTLPTQLAFGLDRAPVKDRTCPAWPTIAQFHGRRMAAYSREIAKAKKDLMWQPGRWARYQEQVLTTA